jgi:branched-chain amino acid transport system ATP-binding protein
MNQTAGGILSGGHPQAAASGQQPVIETQEGAASEPDSLAAAARLPPTASETMLELRDVSVNYGGIQALQGVNLSVNAGEIVTLIGANGAGKSTTLRTISRLLNPRAGRIIYEGRDITQLRPDAAVRLGIAQCPEGRRVLARFSVLDNLEMGAYTRTDRGQIREDIERQFATFPILGERRKQLAGTLSGGEQQMLAIARALMSRPRLLLLDEPSLGLAPLVVRGIFQTIRELHAQGVTILLVEQNANLALQYADRGYVLEAGRITISGPASDLANDDRVRQAYLG